MLKLDVLSAPASRHLSPWASPLTSPVRRQRAGAKPQSLKADTDRAFSL